MPRVNLNVPPVEPFKGVILERQRALRLSDRAMSEKLGLSNAMFSLLMRRPIDEWQLKHLKKTCTILGIPKDTLRANI